MGKRSGLIAALCGVVFVAGAAVGAGTSVLLRPKPTPVFEETRFLNFDVESTPTDALVAGFSGFEHGAEHDTYVWCEKIECTLAVETHGKRDRIVRVRTWPFPYPNAPVQTVTVRVNDVIVATHDLKGPDVWEWSVASTLWKDGKNLIELEMAYAEAPSTRIVGSSDTRTLSVAFDWLEVIPL